MHRSLKVLAGILLIGFVAQLSAAGDLTIVSKVTSAMGGPSTSTQYLAEGRMRMHSGNDDTIVDLNAGKMVMIDHKKKSYSEATFEEMREHFAEMAEMINSNPMMSKMVGNISDIDVNKTLETREILGYTCTKYILSMGENFQQVLWVTPELKIPAEYYEASKAMYAMMGPMATRFEKMLESMKQIEGFSLATEVNMEVMGRDASSSSEVVEVKKGAIPDDIFAAPSGYKKKKSPFGD